MMYLETLKQCNKCKKWKSLSEFGKNSNRKDGLHYYCKNCANEARANLKGSLKNK